MMYLVRYKIKNRTKKNPHNDERVFNPDYTIEVMSGVWCNEKKKQIPLGEIDNATFRKVAGILTCGYTDPRGIIKERISKERYVALRSFLKAAKNQ